MRTIPALAAMAAMSISSSVHASHATEGTIAMNDGPMQRPPRMHYAPTSEQMLAEVVKRSSRLRRARQTHPGKRP